MSVKNIFFDCFGTLVNFNDSFGKKGSNGHFAPSSQRVVWQVLQEQGINKTLAEVLQAMNLSWQRCEMEYGQDFFEISSWQRFYYFLDYLDILPKNMLIKACVEAHINYMIQATVVESAMTGWLQGLNKSYNLSVLSNFNYQQGLQDIIAYHQLDKYFDKIISSESLGYRKPSSIFFNKALKEVNYDRAETLYVGDSLHYDAEGASQANVEVVIIGEEGIGSLYPHLDNIGKLSTYLS